VIRRVASAGVASAGVASAGVAIACLILAGVLAACGGPSPAIPSGRSGDPTVPPLLAGLELATVRIGSRVHEVAIADTPASRSRGLAGADDLGPVDGLLFVYPEPVEQTFYMRGVRMPLDIAFVGADRRVLRALTMPLCTADPCPTYASPGPFKWALETPAGGLGGVVVGDIVEIAPGPSPA
jgi:uncharacterized membrane protein (UPF0127 family)